MAQGFATRSFSSAQLKTSFKKINWSYQGQVCEVVGTIIEAILPNCPLGTIVQVNSNTNRDILAEVVGFKKDRVLLLPYTHLSGISPGSEITPLRTFTHIPVGDHLLGTVVDAFVEPLQGKSKEPPSNSLFYLLCPQFVFICACLLWLG